MRSTPRPQLIGLLAIALLAAVGLALAWAGGLDGFDGGVPTNEEPLAIGESLGPKSAERVELDGPPPGQRVEKSLDVGGLEVADRSVQSGRQALLQAGVGFAEFRITLAVVDGANGRPIVGAEVTEVLFAGEPLAASSGWRATAANDDGLIDLTCRLPFAEAGSDSGDATPALDLRVAADGFVSAAAAGVRARRDPPRADAAPEAGLSAESSAEGLASTSPYSVTLYAAGSLVLDVLDAPPAAEGKLLLWFAPSARGREPDLELDWPLQRPEAEARGVTIAPSAGGSQRLIFGDLPPGPLSVALALVGSPTALQQALTLTSGEQLVQLLRVSEGEVLNGLVRDLSSKAPVPGVVVIVSPKREGLNQRVDRLPYPPQVTDERGAFSLAGLPLGKIDVELHTEDGLMHPRKVTVVQGNAARRSELRVRGSASLSGRVRAPDGALLAGVEVLVTSGEAASSVRPRARGLDLRPKFGRGVFATVDPATGRFHADSVPSGRKLVVHAMAPGSVYTLAHVTPLRLGELREGLELALLPKPRVSFRVESASGEPVTSLLVNFKGAVDAGLPGGGQRTVVRWSPAQRLDVTAEGLFTASPTVDEPALLRLRWGDRAKVDVEWPEGGVDQVPTFTIVPDPIVLVEVRGSDGVALSGARVSAVMPKSAATAKGQKRAFSRTRTNEFGRARLRLPLAEDGTVPGPLELRVAVSGYEPSAAIEVGEDDALPARALEVVLERTEVPERALVTGRLVRGNGEALLAPRFDGLRGGAAHVDEHAFELRGIRPGRAKIVVHCDLFESQSLPVINLRPGERYDVGEIVMRPATNLAVKVRDAQGKVLKNAQVQLLRLPPAEAGRDGLPRRIKFPAKADGGGAFRRRSIPRAKWRLVVRHRGHKEHRQLIRLSKTTQRIEVRLQARP